MSPSGRIFSLADCNRNWKWTQYNGQVANGTTKKVIGANPARWALSVNGNNQTLYVGGADMNINAPFNIRWANNTSGNTFTVLTYDQVGTLIQDEVWVMSLSLTINWTIIEVLWLPVTPLDV